ncbi:phosphodiesterase [Anaerohalosphaera lusitana]|uniref:Phosphodiesterase n=1 Tax=Anaerohalosphaera lusitana TaxID=1936003 RepID=A0A1U9NG42_9BACT|nr:hypothetical protein [Anaerohalosphaera lusitana]AQT66899.1 phosphodiesterase [Anaerohalosphaera lusitana]
MGIKNIIIMSVIGLVSFAGAFGFGLLTREKKAPEQSQNQDGQVQGAGAGAMDGTTPGDGESGETIALAKNKIKEIERNLEAENPQRTMTEQQLKTLIYDVRSRLDDFKQREERIAKKEERLAVTQQELQKNIKELSDLRVKLAGAVTSLQQERQALEQTIIKVEALESQNVKKTAAVYDKMKSDQAAEVLSNMAENNQLEYAVKILYYMTERTCANALGEISRDEPSMAAVMSDKLRLIKEE